MTVDMIESVIVGGFASLGSVLAAIPKVKMMTMANSVVAVNDDDLTNF